MKDIEQLVLGNHTAFFYRNRKEQFDVMMPYVAIGLARHERCFYVVGDNSVKIVIDAMRQYGIDVDLHVKSGALTVTTVQDAFLKNSSFDPERMISDLAIQVEESIKQGYAGFRGTAEMLWTLEFPEACDKLPYYEAQLDKRFPSKFVAICQYNEPCFGPELSAHILTTHSKIIARGRLIGNFYHGAAQGESNTGSFQPQLEKLLTVE